VRFLYRYYAQRREMRSLQQSFDELTAAYRREVDAHAFALKQLAKEEQRAAHLALLSTEPCPMCRELEEERDTALLRLDDVCGELDEVRAALVWLERDFKVGS
jgi:hypothetical protein